MARWGILSTGKIAHDFSTALQYVEGATITAVASRSQEKAAKFISDLNLEGAAAFGSCDELVACTEVDVVYIASPHSMHHEHALKCVRGGKNVLCEKALTMNARQAREVLAAARENNVFFMEAMWSRFLPATLALQRELSTIGEVVGAVGSFGFVDPGIARLGRKELGGGAVLDIGVYLVNWACIAFGDAPGKVVCATGNLKESGVDEQVAFTLRFGPRSTASLFCTLAANPSNEFEIIGTEGRIRVHAPFWTPTEFTVVKGESEQRHSFPHVLLRAEHNFNFVNSIGLKFEAEHVQECLAQDLKESPVMPHARSLAVMDILDELRLRVGARFPCDEQ